MDTLAKMLGDFAGRNFLINLHRRFDSAILISRESHVELRGILSFTTVISKRLRQAQCQVLIRRDWIERQPDVLTTEEWVRRDMDWHSYKNGGLCWELALHWKERLHAELVQRDIASVSDFASEWLINSVKGLLAKHFIGQRLAMESWHNEWPQWRHGEAGVRQYQRIKGAA